MIAAHFFFLLLFTFYRIEKKKCDKNVYMCIKKYSKNSNTRDNIVIKCKGKIYTHCSSYNMVVVWKCRFISTHTGTIQWNILGGVMNSGTMFRAKKSWCCVTQGRLVFPKNVSFINSIEFRSQCNELFNKFLFEFERTILLFHVCNLCGATHST